ncbi:MAG: hypothetical protein Kow0062_28000 [Acidobacteriota bacterium]
MELVEIPCPACGGVNEVAERDIPRSGVVECRFCGDAIAFRTPEDVPEIEPASGPVLPPPEEVFSGPDPSLEQELRGGGARPVRCPHCGHEFVPSTAEARATVLIVEDTDFFLEVASSVLRDTYQVLTARSTAEAREVLATHPVDLLVLDLTLPDGEGIDVLRALPRPDIPALIYTSRDETTLIGPEWERYEQLGARDVVRKGLNVEETLARKVAEILAGGPVETAPR